MSVPTFDATCKHVTKKPGSLLAVHDATFEYITSCGNDPLSEFAGASTTLEIDADSNRQVKSGSLKGREG